MWTMLAASGALCAVVIGLVWVFLLKRARAAQAVQKEILDIEPPMTMRDSFAPRFNPEAPAPRIEYVPPSPPTRADDGDDLLDTALVVGGGLLLDSLFDNDNDDNKTGGSSGGSFFDGGGGDFGGGGASGGWGEDD